MISSAPQAATGLFKPSFWHEASRHTIANSPPTHRSYRQAVAAEPAPEGGGTSASSRLPVLRRMLRNA